DLLRLSAYLKGFDAGRPLPALYGPPEIAGRFHYNAALDGLNFRRARVTLGAAFDQLRMYAGQTEPPSLSVQSLPTRGALAGFETANPLPLLDDRVEPRIWLGNATVTPAHHDPQENIACVVAGRRRFTLFPPEQLPNLYIGPFEHTPAGAAVSMVDFDAPDLTRHPRFAEAWRSAMVADLEPGDALYIPCLWWHHVRSFGPLNMLVNYWWTPADPARGDPFHALMHALVAVRDLPAHQRDAWRVMFEHHVFEPVLPNHLPVHAQGMLGPLDARRVRAMQQSLVRALDALSTAGEGAKGPPQT
ncbi:MAG: cupin-like domain-containing protein, partial [Caulobacteraceae bacterium]